MATGLLQHCPEGSGALLATYENGRSVMLLAAFKSRTTFQIIYEPPDQEVAESMGAAEIPLPTQTRPPRGDKSKVS